MPEPIALTIRGEDTVVAYACGKCHYVVATAKDCWNAEAIARAHCEKPVCKTEGCGGEAYYNRLCEPCYRVNLVRHQDERAAASKNKVDAKDWSGPVYDDARGKWHPSVDDLLEEYDEGDEPPWVWGAHVVEMSIDASSVLESALDEASEEAQEDIGQLADRLQPILDKFCKDNPTEWWEQRDTVVVIESGFFKKEAT